MFEIGTRNYAHLFKDFRVSQYALLNIIWINFFTKDIIKFHVSTYIQNNALLLGIHPSQWAKSPKKQSVGVCNMALYFEC